MTDVPDDPESPPSDEDVTQESVNADSPSEETGMVAEQADDGSAAESDGEAQMMAMLDEEPAPAAADFAEFPDTGPEADPAALSLLYDLSLPVAVELGRTRMSVQEILALGRGSVVQLDRLAGEPIDVFVGDRRFAEGEVVVLGEHFGIRITRVISNVAPGMAKA